ncbi:hypothetical protein KXD40_006453 [Peronospora effusa]|nr:hypothetical protein KXD40_006453 [Peronospora effusa]
MNEFDVDRLINQMVNFIYQKTQEKANEIRIKTKHDFYHENKQMLVHNAQLKLSEEYKRKEKEREVYKHMVRAKDVEVAEMVVTEATDKRLTLDVNEVTVTVNKIGDGMLSNAKAGGVVLYAKQGKGIVCDNTLDTRLDQIYYDLKPTVRKMLSPTP